MKKILLFNVLFLFFSTSFIYSQCGNLYIAGVIDGPLSGGTPKGVQVCASGDIADLSIYGLGTANNGGGTDGEEYTFPAVQLTSGQCVWVAGTGNGGLAGFANWFGFDPCYSDSDIDANGDDAYELFCNGTLSDVFGDPNEDGTGECWEFLDGWAKRSTSAPSTTFSCGDWTFSGTNALDGESSNATATTPYPTPSQVNCIDIPLNVDLFSFTAKPMDSDIVSLDWSTASEENNEYFSIEHSTNGRDFIAVDEVEGALNSTEMQYYNYMHKEASKGMNYYRLRQVDTDGTFSFSPIQAVRLNAVIEIEVNPTIADATISVVLADAFDKEATIEIYNVLGALVASDVFARGEAQTTLNVSDLQSGHYFIRLSDGLNTQTTRFIKK